MWLSRWLCPFQAILRFVSSCLVSSLFDLVEKQIGSLNGPNHAYYRETQAASMRKIPPVSYL